MPLLPRLLLRVAVTVVDRHRCGDGDAAGLLRLGLVPGWLVPCLRCVVAVVGHWRS